MLRDFKQNNYIDFFNVMQSVQVNESQDNGELWYGYIPKNGVHFEDVFNGITVPENAKVVDLGCGFCESLLYLGSVLNTQDLHGVELNQQYFTDIQAITTALELPLTLYNQNYADHDISDYDVIYSYCPAKDINEYNAFNDYVLENMKVDAVWIEVYKSSENGNDSVDTAIARYTGTVEKLYEDELVVVVKKMV